MSREEENRPNPEEILRAIKAEEIQHGKGELKIFLGMAAGVGKTYAMLSEAQELAREGVDVVIGIVETHGRHETAFLTKDLDKVPESKIVYKDVSFKELDVEAIILRRPKIVLVDELAHSNIPGSKHNKRWQDVIDILDQGIDVYSTLNVQHIESLNDVVSGITDISIRETVPDSIIERAASIHLVDLTPDDLLERLQEGKVYLGNQSQIAIEHFFKKDTLTALREVVLRYAADKVDRDLRQMIPTDERIVEWKPREKFLVGVSSNPYSQKLIRITRRLAFNSDAPWIAVHINDGRVLDEKETQVLEKNLAIARDLGAEVVTINDPNITEGLQRIARQRGVTQIIVGRDPPERFLGIFKAPSIFDKLLQECSEVDIHVIRQHKHTIGSKKKFFSYSKDKTLAPYFYLLACVILVSLANWLALPFIGYKLAGSFFLVGILGLSLFFKKGPLFSASILFAIIWTFFFIPPRGTLYVESNEDLVLLGLFLITALTSGILVDRAREHKEMLIKGEESTLALYEIVRQIANSTSTTETLKYLRERLCKIIEGNFDFIIKEIDNGVDLNGHPLIQEEKERNGGIWCYESGKEAGWSTDTLPSLKNLYIPLKGLHEVIGLCIYRPKSNKKISLEDKSFLYAVCQQLGNHVERMFIYEKTKQHEYFVRMEGIQKNIFEQFLEAFEYPITQAQIALANLKDRVGNKSLEVNTLEASCKMISQILTNIHAIIQINEGMLPLRKSETDLEAVLRDCLVSLKIPASEHILDINIQNGIPKVPCDEYLIEILICNLVLNAIKYSPKQSTIEIQAKIEGNYFVLTILDQGIGISQNQLENLFQKFNRFSEEISVGMGLGLSISKTIAEIHNGKLIAENIPSKGEKFTLYLPLN